MGSVTQIPSSVLRENALRKVPWAMALPQGSAASVAIPPDVSNVTNINQAPPTPPASPTFQNAIFNEFDFTGGITLSADPKRIYLLIQNQGAGVMYFSTTATGTFTTGLQIAVSGYYEPFVAPITQIGVNGTGVILVGTLP